MFLSPVKFAPPRSPTDGRWIAAGVLEKPRFSESAETYRVTGGRARPRYLKIASLQTAPALDSEAERLAWLGGRLPVSELLGFVRKMGATICSCRRVPGVTVGEAEDVPAAHRVELLARGLRSKWARIEALQRKRDFLLDYADALASLLARVVGVLFPAGTIADGGWTVCGRAFCG